VANLIFYVIAALCVAAAVGVVLFKNPISNVLALLASFFCLATIYLLAGFQFLAATQILVYAGAIMVLFLFVIMLLNLANVPSAGETGLAVFLRRRGGLTVAVAAALGLLGLAAVLGTKSTSVAAAAEMPAKGIDAITATPDSNAGLAAEMFGRYLLPFEAVSMLLLATVVAVVVLAKRNREPLEPRTAGGARAASGGRDERVTVGAGSEAR
jgi:NADH-quinone oxidoreductase subunit J